MAFVLSAALAVTIAGVDQRTAGQLVESAHLFLLECD
jgi:hypothetical protein